MKPEKNADFALKAGALLKQMIHGAEFLDPDAEPMQIHIRAAKAWRALNGDDREGVSTEELDLLRRIKGAN